LNVEITPHGLIYKAKATTAPKLAKREEIIPIEQAPERLDSVGASVRIPRSAIEYSLGGHSLLVTVEV
jgi:hypothetical protein